MLRIPTLIILLFFTLSFKAAAEEHDKESSSEKRNSALIPVYIYAKDSALSSDRIISAFEELNRIWRRQTGIEFNFCSIDFERDCGFAGVACQHEVGLTLEFAPHCDPVGCISNFPLGIAGGGTTPEHRYSCICDSVGYGICRQTNDIPQQWQCQDWMGKIIAHEFGHILLDLKDPEYNVDFEDHVASSWHLNLMRRFQTNQYPTIQLDAKQRKNAGKNAGQYVGGCSPLLQDHKN